MESSNKYDGLLHFLKASSKTQVIKCFSICVSNIISSGSLKDHLINIVDFDEIDELSKSLDLFVRDVIYYDYSTVELLKPLFSSGFDKKLKDLICRIVVEKITEWKNEIVINQVSIPKLISYEYSLNDNEKSKSCLLHVKTTANEEKTSILIDKETLATVIDSLAIIRDQISSIAK